MNVATKGMFVLRPDTGKDLAFGLARKPLKRITPMRLARSARNHVHALNMKVNARSTVTAFSGGGLEAKGIFQAWKSTWEAQTQHCNRRGAQTANRKGQQTRDIQNGVA